MAVTYGFYDSVGGDRKYNAEEFSRLFDGIIVDGVFHSVGDVFKVKPGTGLQVIVGTGRAWFDGTWTYNDADLPISLDSPDVVGRIDAVVIEVNRDILQRKNEIKIIKGTPSTSPVKPALANTDTLSQHALAYITVKNGVDAITEADIESVVGRPETPFVTGPLTTVDVDHLFSKWEEEFDTWFEHIQTELSGDVAGNLQVQIDKLEANKLNVSDSGYLKIDSELYEAIPTSDKLLAEYDILRPDVNNAAPVVTENYCAFIRYDSVVAINKSTKAKKRYDIRIFNDIFNYSGSSNSIRMYPGSMMGDCVYMVYSGDDSAALFNLSNGKWIKLPTMYTSSDFRTQYSPLGLTDDTLIVAYDYQTSELRWLEIDLTTMTSGSSGSAILEDEYGQTTYCKASSINRQMNLVGAGGRGDNVLILSVFDAVSKSVNNFPVKSISGSSNYLRGKILYIDPELTEVLIIVGRYNSSLTPRYTYQLIGVNYQTGVTRTIIDSITTDLPLENYGDNFEYYFSKNNDRVVLAVGGTTYEFDILKNTVVKIYENSPFYLKAFECLKNIPNKYYVSLYSDSYSLSTQIYDIDTGETVSVFWKPELSISGGFSAQISHTRYGELCLHSSSIGEIRLRPNGGITSSINAIFNNPKIETDGKYVSYFQKKKGGA